MIVKSILVAALGACVVLLAGCVAQPTARTRQPPVVAPSDVARAGRMHGYVAARRHSDFILVDGKEQRREVEYGWDYDHRVALRKTFDLAGHLLETKDMTGADLALTEAEAGRVRELVRGQPALKSLVDHPDVVIWAGGFAFRKTEDPYCGRGSRCIHAIAAAHHGDAAIAHAIVDLQSDRVVYPFYQPADGEPVGKIHGE